MLKNPKIALFFSTILIVIFSLNAATSVASAQEDSEFKNLAAGLNYTISTGPRDAYPDTGGKELTDGRYAPKKYTNPAWQGHHINDGKGIRTIQFDLGQAKSIRKISANFLHDPDTGIRFPVKVTIEVSSDGDNWTELSDILSKKSLGYEYVATQRFFWDGNEDGIPKQPVKASMVYAQYVRLQIVMDSPWLFIDEVEIWGLDEKVDGVVCLTPIENKMVDTEVTLNSEKQTNIQTNMTTTLSETGMRNLSGGMDYQISIPARNNYPDTGGELTDGKYGQKSYYDKAWQGHNKADGLERSVIFDLGEAKSIKHISANFLHFPSAGMAFPSKVDIDVSMDGKEWGALSEVLSKKLLNYEYTATQRFFWDGDEDGLPTLPVDINMVYAKYVRIRFTIEAKAWAFIDEIEIWGADGKIDGAEILPTEEDDPTAGLPEGADYMRCGDQTSGINNLALLYNHVNREWKKDNILPYLSYMDKKGTIKDWFFDGVLYLGLKTPEGKTFDTSTKSASNMKDWQWYLDRTFKETGDMEELNSAAKEVADALGESDKKVKVFLMVPYPSPSQAKFGDIDGVNLNFSHDEVGQEEAFENRKKAVKWYTDEVIKNWGNNSYSNLELVGLYWLGETINTGIPKEEELVKYTSNLIHEYKLKHLWIPYFKASGRSKWKEYGFDMAVIQPNYYFDGYAKPTRLRDASIFARKYGMGIEMEFDERITKSDEEGKIFRAKYNKYLDDGVEYKFTGDVFKAYYQGGTGLLECARSDEKEIREIYYNTYKFVRGQYPPKEEEEPPKYEGIVINKCTFTDMLGKHELNALQPGGSLMANITVGNDDTKENSVVIITALYDKDEKLERIALVEKTLASGEAENIKAGFDITGDVDGRYVKVLVWDSIETMNPISNVITFPQK